MDQTVDDRDWTAMVERRPRCGRPGQRLKTLRNGRNITVREVEHASRRIAEEKGDKRFCISNGWLAQLENGVSEPNIQKFFSLSVIYRVSYVDLLRLYDVDVDEREKYETIADPYLTRLIVPNANAAPDSNEPDDTSLITGDTHVSGNSNRTPHIIHARLGLTEFTMYPMIRPGAVLRIDTNQNKLIPGASPNEYERPIYFIELRGGYACGWCELQGNQLRLIPHPISPMSVQLFTYPREAEIIGRVVGYETACVDVESELTVSARRKIMARRNNSK
jgi:transcriptional regulator with XRE-family HTH domain